MNNAAPRLTDIPESGNDLEDYVAALFQASQYYIEKSIVEQDPDNVLELDIYATHYQPGRRSGTLVEVKGKKGWGNSDLFKLVGWMTYLQEKRGAFFAVDCDGDIQALRDRFRTLGITIVLLRNSNESSRIFTESGFNRPISDDLVTLWRYAYSVERRLVDTLVSGPRTHRDRIGPKQALKYHRLINDKTYFARSPVEALGMLYEAYGNHPKLTQAYSIEQDTGDYDTSARQRATKSLSQAMYKGGNFDVQACLYVEHRARLAILKAAVDCAITQSDRLDEEYFQEELARIGIARWSPPASFLSGIRWLRNRPSLERYPIFWQQFIRGWGGFFLDEKREEEFEWMAHYSGVPEGEVPVVLEAFDRFFPTRSEWLVRAGKSSAIVLKLVPMVFRGIGSHHRRQQYEIPNFSTPEYDWYTADNLRRWNDDTYKFLTQ